MKRIPPPQKNDLEQMYLNDHASFVEIAKTYNVSVGTIQKWFREYDIVAYPRGVKGGMRATCRILKHHASDLKDDPERLSTEFMQNLIGAKCDEH